MLSTHKKFPYLLQHAHSICSFKVEHVKLKPYKYFQFCGVSLPVASEGIMEAKAATIYIQQPSSGPLVAMRGLRTELACLLGWKPSLCHWRRQCGGIKLTVGGRNQ